MTEADQFLAAIIADPDDDLPRLVFADWLEEHGDAARAEFIRVQCALAAGPGDETARGPLEVRSRDLLAANLVRWKIAGIPGVQTFRRGFVEHLYIAAVDFLAHADHIGRAAPVVDLRLSAAAAYLGAIPTVPWLGRLRGLEFTNDTISGRLLQLFRPGLFPHLRSLTLRNNRLWPENVATLVQLAADWPALERLDLSGNYTGDEGVAHLAAAATVSGLRELILRSDDIDYEYTIHAAGAAALARSATLTGLRTLNLAGQRIGDGGFRSLVESPVTSSLEVLDVSRNEIGEIGPAWAAALVASPHLSRLRELNLSRNSVDRLAAKELAGWPHLGTGCVVDLRGCVLLQPALRLLHESPYRDQFVGLS